MDSGAGEHVVCLGSYPVCKDACHQSQKVSLVGGHRKPCNTLLAKMQEDLYNNAEHPQKNLSTLSKARNTLSRPKAIENPLSQHALEPKAH